jgi:hypothetical protein
MVICTRRFGVCKSLVAKSYLYWPSNVKSLSLRLEKKWFSACSDRVT